MQLPFDVACKLNKNKFDFYLQYLFFCSRSTQFLTFFLRFASKRGEREERRGSVEIDWELRSWTRVEHETSGTLFGGSLMKPV